MTEIPNYMGHVMNFNIKSVSNYSNKKQNFEQLKLSDFNGRLLEEFLVFQNSILSALPYFVLWILSFAMSFSSDSLIIRRILSIGNSRKVFNSIGKLTRKRFDSNRGYLMIFYFQA